LRSLPLAPPELPAQRLALEDAPYKGRRRGGKKTPTYLPTYLFLRFFEISGLILENIFMVFLGSSCRETAKNAIKKNRWEKDDRKKKKSSTFSAKSFLHGFSPKIFLWCF
jgi:hypothetical protein